MELLVIAGAAVALWYFAHNKTPATADTQTPTPPVPTAEALPTGPAFSGASSIVSGGYQTAPYGATNAPPMGHGLPAAPRAPADVFGTYAASAATLAATIASPPVPAPAPAVRGGIAGTIGTGGKPLGGALRTGVSAGTGTTVRPPLTAQNILPLTKVMF